MPASPARSLAAGASLRRRAGAPLRMVFGGNDPEKPKLTREDEPEEFFSSSFESMPAEEKLKDPLVIIGRAAAPATTAAAARRARGRSDGRPRRRDGEGGRARARAETRRGDGGTRAPRLEAAPAPRRLVSIFFPFALLVVFNAAGMI